MSIIETGHPEFIGAGHVRYYSLARHALIEAFRLIGIRPGTRVLLPGYLCRDLLAPLHILGATPCWYDVKPDLTPEKPPEEWPSADAVLAVNYFGFPQALEPFLAYAERTGATIVEDNAHGYMSRDQDGQWLGCRTGLGVFSLRKTLRIPDGAALWAGNKYTSHELPTQCEFNGTGVNRAQIIKAQFRDLPLIGEFAYRFATGLARELRKIRTGSEVPANDPKSENELSTPPNPWPGLLTSIAGCNVMVEVKRRRTAYENCIKAAKKVGAVPVFDKLPQYCVPYAFAFRGGAAAAEAMRRYAKRCGFDFVCWPDLPSEIAAKAPVHYRNVFLVNFLW